MKRLAILSLLSITIIGVADPAVGQPRIGEFNRAQMTQMNLGCGISLRKPNSSNWVFSDDFSENIKMIIDGKMTQLVRVTRSDQKTRISQTYRSRDKKIIVDFNVRRGKLEYEGFNLERGTLRVRKGGQQTRIVVVGYYGC